MPHMKLIISCFTIFYIFSCVDTEILSGLWDGKETVNIPVENKETPFKLELVLGHFGPEVSGLIKFSPDYKNICSCRHIEKGSFSNEKFNFSFKSPFPCDNNASYISGELIYDSSNDVISGEFFLNENSIGKTSFLRIKEKEDILPADKECKY